MWKTCKRSPLFSPEQLRAQHVQEHPTGAGRGGLKCPEGLHQVAGAYARPATTKRFGVRVAVSYVPPLAPSIHKCPGRSQPFSYTPLTLPTNKKVEY